MKTIGESLTAANIRIPKIVDNINISDILSDEETQKVLLAAVKQKQAQIRTEAYWAEVRRETVVPELTWEEYLEDIQEIAEAEKMPLVIDQYNEEPIRLMAQYFSNSPEFEKNGYYSLKKGLLVYGPVGVGKTQLMKLFTCSPKGIFRLVDCSDVAGIFKKSGEEGIEKFFKDQQFQYRNPFNHSIQGICFDDLGIESDGRYFGNQVNVMERIMDVRYRSRNLLYTHIITNLNTKEINDRYGIRFLDRCKEMFNVITFDPAAPSRRK